MQIQVLIESLFSQATEVVVDSLNNSDAWPQLLEQEQAQVATAIDKRQREFAVGRNLAKKIMARLNIDPSHPLLSGEKREPLWPAGMLGAITHAGSLCAVVGCLSNTVRKGIGIDIEEQGRFKADMQRLICLDEEIAWADTQEIIDPLDARLLIFSAKEAFYKAQFPISKRFVGFKDVKVTCTQCSKVGDQFEFDFTFVKDDWAFTNKGRGCFF